MGKPAVAGRVGWCEGAGDDGVAQLAAGALAAPSSAAHRPSAACGQGAEAPAREGGGSVGGRAGQCARSHGGRQPTQPLAARRAWLRPAHLFRAAQGRCGHQEGREEEEARRHGRGGRWVPEIQRDSRGDDAVSPLAVIQSQDGPKRTETVLRAGPVNAGPAQHLTDGQYFAGLPADVTQCCRAVMTQRLYCKYQQHLDPSQAARGLPAARLHPRGSCRGLEAAKILQERDILSFSTSFTRLWGTARQRLKDLGTPAARQPLLPRPIPVREPRWDVSRGLNPYRRPWRPAPASQPAARAHAASVA
jgi:hypothetical protein